jgi:hypothetical protein
MSDRLVAATEDKRPFISGGDCPNKPQTGIGSRVSPKQQSSPAEERSRHFREEFPAFAWFPAGRTMATEVYGSVPFYRVRFLLVLFRNWPVTRIESRIRVFVSNHRGQR